MLITTKKSSAFLRYIIWKIFHCYWHLSKTTQNEWINYTHHIALHQNHHHNLSRHRNATFQGCNVYQMCTRTDCSSIRFDSVDFLKIKFNRNGITWLVKFNTTKIILGIYFHSNHHCNLQLHQWNLSGMQYLILFSHLLPDKTAFNYLVLIKSKETFCTKNYSNFAYLLFLLKGLVKRIMQ